MYIALAWTPATGGTAAELDAAIDNVLQAMGFEDAFRPVGVVGFFFASIPGGSRAHVDDLQTELRKLPLTFAISASLRGWDIWRSPDVDRAACRRVVDHAE
jgi:hypothetical protein